MSSALVKLAAAIDGGHRARRPQMIGGSLVVALMGAVGMLPPFAGPGYEAALAAGLLCPATAAVITSSVLTSRRLAPLDGLTLGVSTGLRVALLAYLVLLAHGLRAGFCNFWTGTELFVLGPGMGAVLAGVWGAAVAELAAQVRRPRRRKAAAVLLGLAGPLGSAVGAVILFYATPMVFAYDPFVGYFSGAMYDTVLEPAGLRTYRAASLATLFGCYVVATHLARRPAPQSAAGGRPARLRFSSTARPGLLLAGALCLVGSAGSVALGSGLGHWQTSGTIAAELGAEEQAGRCRVVYARTIPVDQARRFARDCDAHVAAVARWLGSSERAPVTVYLFADAGQKRWLMGAAGVSIAKPWRREIYVHHGPYPHRSLGHELAHVLVGPFGRGPFDIAGAAAGWLPDPGLIEGVAVASQPPRGDLTNAQWAKAMRDIGILPQLDDIFGLSFFGQHSSTAYTAAGAFVHHVHHHHGSPTVRRWYGGEALPALTGVSMAEMERAWHAELDTIELSEAARAQAEARFDRPGVYARRCPHAVDAGLAMAAYRYGAGDLAGSLAAYEAALELDAGNTAGLLGRVSCLEQLERPSDASSELQRIVDDGRVPRAARDRAAERLGDLALRGGDLETARRWYRQVRTHTVDEDRLRTLDVKLHALDDDTTRPAVTALLVGSDHRGPSNLEALDRLGVWRAAAPEDGTVDYLLARQYLEGHRYERAAERLDAALAASLSLERVRTESLRLRLRAACALGDSPTATDAYQRYAVRPGVPSARQEAAQALLERCTR